MNYSTTTIFDIHGNETVDYGFLNYILL